MIDRRTVLIGLCALALAASGRSSAQRAKSPRIGCLFSGSRPASFSSGTVGAFLQAMRDLGYVQGKNIEYEWRFTDGRAERAAELAKELVRLKVDLIVTAGTTNTRTAQNATKEIPIVMVFVGDPVGTGLVASLARPGANITGIANLNVEMNAKRVELLVRVFPKLSRAAALLNPANPTHAANLAGLQSGSEKSKLTLLALDARTPAEIERAFSAMKHQNAQALIVHTDGLFMTQARQIAELAAGLKLPVIGPRQVVEQGGLMSYVADINAAYRRAATYVDKILKGAAPADLPVEQPTKLELVINLKAARNLGISVPPDLMLLADQVIQ